MKTLIELYDSDNINNIIASAVFKAERVVFITPSDNDTPGASQRLGIEKFIKSRSPGASVYYCRCDTSDCADILRALKRITSSCADCAVDVTGGSDVALLAVGMMSALHGIPVFSYKYSSGRFYNIYGFPYADSANLRPILTVADRIMTAGLRVSHYGRLPPDSFTPPVRDDIMRVWEVFRRSYKWWTELASFMQACSARRHGLCVSSALKAGENSRVGRILSSLYACGILRSLVFNGEKVSFSYKNELFASLLCDAGVWLELYCAVTLGESELFDDCAASVCVDWNAAQPIPRELRTTNEIDTVATRGAEVYFISCKLSSPTTQALNEIHTLASVIGGERSHAVLVTMGKVDSDAPFVQRRASELGIILIDRGDILGHRLIKRLLLRS